MQIIPYFDPKTPPVPRSGAKEGSFGTHFRSFWVHLGGLAGTGPRKGDETHPSSPSKGVVDGQCTVSGRMGLGFRPQLLHLEYKRAASLHRRLPVHPWCTHRLFRTTDPVCRARMLINPGQNSRKVMNTCPLCAAGIPGVMGIWGSSG